MDNTKNITVLSLCTGYGGLELGLHRALGRPLRVVAVEVEAFAAANLVAKAEEGKLAIEALYPDIKTFPAERFSGCFDFILAGYPCQPFSVAGKRKGEADERHLWPFIRTHIQQIRPVWVFLENVAGHLRLGFDRVVRDLDELGYRVEAGLFTAAEVGAPHRRERLFILAHAQSNRPLRESSGICGANGRPGGTLPRQFVKPSEISRLQETENGSDPEGRPATTGDLGGLLETDGRNGEELANSSRLGRRGRDNGEPAGQGRALQAEGPSELADTCQQRLSEPTCRELRSLSGQANRNKGCESGGIHAERNGEWPARPGQEQYEWEEPRTIKSGMGRTVDGFRSRVDELRLLGNGVVPAQAELAFRTLYEELTK